MLRYGFPTIVHSILGKPEVPSSSSESRLYIHSENLYQKEGLIPKCNSWDQVLNHLNSGPPTLARITPWDPKQV